MEYIHIIAGAVVGLVIGLTGVGGGSLMTPILVLAFNITPSIAVGTDLLYAAITKSSGVFFHQRNKTVNWKIVRLLASGSIPSSILTILLLQKIQNLGINYDDLMMNTLSVMLILTSLIIFGKSKILLFIHTHHTNSPLINFIRKQRPKITFFAGCVLGILVTLSSVGAGAIGAAILLMLYPREKAITIVGTDLAHAVPLTAIAGIGHLQFGTVDLHLLSGLLLGGIPSIYIGSFIGKKLPDKLLRPLIATFLIILGIKLAI